MTNQEILTKAIEKAVAGGWKNEDMLSADSHIDGWLFDPGIGEYGGHREPHSLIFNHDFAKALWGEDKLLAWGYSPTKYVGSPHPIKFTDWQYHLQQMVIAEDPIKYLGDTI